MVASHTGNRDHSSPLQFDMLISPSLRTKDVFEKLYIQIKSLASSANLPFDNLIKV